MSTAEICFMTATEMVNRIRAKELSCRQVMEAHLDQIDRLNPMPFARTEAKAGQLAYLIIGANSEEATITNGHCRCTGNSCILSVEITVD